MVSGAGSVLGLGDAEAVLAAVEGSENSSAKAVAADGSSLAGTRFLGAENEVIGSEPDGNCCDTSSVLGDFSEPCSLVDGGNSKVVRPPVLPAADFVSAPERRKKSRIEGSHSLERSEENSRHEWQAASFPRAACQVNRNAPRFRRTPVLKCKRSTAGQGFVKKTLSPPIARRCL